MEPTGAVADRQDVDVTRSLKTSRSGKPFREPNSGSPGGQTCAGVTPVYTILHISQGAVAANGFSADGYNSVWAQVGAVIGREKPGHGGGMANDQAIVLGGGRHCRNGQGCPGQKCRKSGVP